MSTFLNYLGQLRLYSASDLVLLLMAAHTDLRHLIACLLLWFGFLVFLESIHKDRGRKLWPRWLWFSLWVAGGLLSNSASVLPFVATCWIYSLKKRYPFGAFSFLSNGLLKALLLATIPGTSTALLATVVVAMSLRNLAGDFRDAGKDAAEGVMTFPVLIGYRRNTPCVYPICLVATSLLWTIIGHLHGLYLLAVLAIQALTYRLTPR